MSIDKQIELFQQELELLAKDYYKLKISEEVWLTESKKFLESIKQLREAAELKQKQSL